MENNTYTYTSSFQIKISSGIKGYEDYAVSQGKNPGTGNNLSTNNNLSALSVSGYAISPTFASGTTSYTLTVPNNISLVTVNGSLADTKATVTGLGTCNLEGGTEKNYTITVTRQVVTTELTDSSTGIKLNAPANTIPDGITLEVNRIEESRHDQLKAILIKNVSSTQILGKAVSFDINLMQGVSKIQPHGKVLVSIPLPQGFGIDLKVFKIKTDNSVVTYNVNIVTSDGKQYAQFETDSFSQYMLVEATQANNLGSDNNQENNNVDKNPQTSAVYLSMTFVCSIVLICGLVIKQTRHKNYF